MWDRLSDEVAEEFAGLSVPEMHSALRRGHAGRLRAALGPHQQCTWVPPPRRSERDRRTHEEALAVRKAWRERTGYTQRAWAEVAADLEKLGKKRAYQRSWRAATGATAREWAALKADPARHAAELQKRRERRLAKRQIGVGQTRSGKCVPP